MPEVTLRIGGTEALTPARLEALSVLIDELRELGLDGEISYRPPTGRGVTWYEVTLIYLGAKALDVVTGNAIEALLKLVTSKAIEWARLRLGRGETVRPQSITIYGPGGKPLKTIRIKKDGAAEESDGSS
jgi:hypothetical protein